MIGSLFSGIGGIDLGLESLGLGPVAWQCDSDPFARACLAARWPGVRCYEDVREIDANAARVSVVCGGFPCQPHSFAGRRRGTADARWLWPEFARVVAAIRPGIVFVENVPGLRTSGLRDVLGDLATLGFDAEWGLYSAAEVGAPHRRNRLFLLAYAHDKGPVAKGRPRAQGRRRPVNGGQLLAHADGEARGSQEGIAVGDNGRQAVRPGEAQPGRCGGDVADAAGLRCLRRVVEQAASKSKGNAAAEGGNPWAAEPGLGRVANGIPHRKHRLRLLGNACVPAQAAYAFRDLAARVLS